MLRKSEKYVETIYVRTDFRRSGRRMWRLTDWFKRIEALSAVHVRNSEHCTENLRAGEHLGLIFVVT